MKKETLVVGITALIENPKNPRVHSEKQIEEIIRSVKMFGQFRPIVCDENNMILAGHGLHKAMVMNGAADVEVIKYTGLDEQQKKKLLLADNKTQSLGKDNFELVSDLIREIDDYEIPGYDDDILDVIRAVEEEDEAMIEQQNEAFEAEYSAPEDVDVLAAGSTEEYKEEVSPSEPNEETEEKPKTFKCPHCGEEICLPL